MHLLQTETLPRGELTEIQGTRLAGQVERLMRSDTAYWVEKMKGVPSVDDIDQITDLPFTEKSEFRDAFPYGMICVPMKDVVRIHASSGTSGKPTIVAYSERDVELFAEVNARALAAAGGGPDDIVHVAYGYGLFTGGLGLHYGVEALGATAVPASGGNPGFQVDLLADTGATGLAATPSFALILAEHASENGRMDDILLRFGIHGAEPWSEGLRLKLEQAWGGSYDACDIYGLSEIIGPGVAVECRENKGGMHVMEDHFYPEIVDPETGEPLEEGERGELVLTTLTREAQPVIRYRTRDITRFLPGECPCGRTGRRIARIEGRADDMLIVRGINVYPRTIETVLMDDPDTGANYLVVVDRTGPQVELTAKTELAEEAVSASADVADRLEKRLAEVVRLRIKVDVGDPGSVPRTEVGKARRVIDASDLA